MTRRAVAADCAGIARLVEQYWQIEHLQGFDQARIERLLQGLLEHPGQGACWVAEERGALCGYVLAAFMFSLEHGGRMAEIDELFVIAERRSAGVGLALMSAAERDLAELGLSRVQLQVATGNLRGRLFYARNGYHRRLGYELMDKPLP